MPAKTEFTIDCTIPAKDNIFQCEELEKFLNEHIKVDNKVNNLGDVVSVSRSDAIITIAVNNATSKRYMKYLTKKYLKKQQLRDYIRVVACSHKGYKLVYFSTADEE